MVWKKSFLMILRFFKVPSRKFRGRFGGVFLGVLGVFMGAFF